MKKVRPPKAKKQNNNRRSDEELHMNDMNGHHGNGEKLSVLFLLGGEGVNVCGGGVILCGEGLSCVREVFCLY